MSEPLRLLVIGAHPDDAEYKAGGLAALYRDLGHEVRFVSVTNGDAGHHELSGLALAARRRAEAEAAAATLGLRYDVWEHSDGRLELSLARREQVIRLIRSYDPDLVLTHRPNDYHPDHRVTSQLVQDAAYLLTVPAICPDVAHLRRDPVIAYLSDDFTRPYPFEPTVVIDVAPVWERKDRDARMRTARSSTSGFPTTLAALPRFPRRTKAAGHGSPPAWKRWRSNSPNAFEGG